jgi:hypothetical protein
MRNEFNYRWQNPVKIRCCAYLNNIAEQDHRRVKFRVQPMLGFKKFFNARRVLIGIELCKRSTKVSSTSSRSEVVLKLQQSLIEEQFLIAEDHEPTQAALGGVTTLDDQVGRRVRSGATSLKRTRERPIRSCVRSRLSVRIGFMTFA